MKFVFIIWAMCLCLPAVFIGCNRQKSSDHADYRRTENRAMFLTAEKPAIKKKTQRSNHDQWKVSKISGSKLIFKNGKALNTRLHHFKYFGMVEDADGTPFFIYGGKKCLDCDEKLNLYIYSPLDTTNDLVRYTYPGKIISEGITLLSTKVFYGQVLDDAKGVAWYTRSMKSDRSYNASLFVVKIDEGRKRNYIIRDTAQFEQTIAYMKKGKSFEIKE